MIRITSEGPVGGTIVETEAYLRDDPACHAYRGETRRNAVMFGPAGRAYVFFTYGCHYCVNVVTEREGIGSATLIRALEPTLGVAVMQRRRGRALLRELTTGPGRLTSALDIDMRHNGSSFGGESEIQLLAKRDERPVPVTVSTRIGIIRGERHPLRFHITGNPFVSRRR